ncbi:hypothetical protein [Prauserella rugosa]|uniref:Uncharacterized protein n=1 Tax=Prauserella rugosa TaxID=43354 RepID=A0A660CGE3_9PSEU|nr:hypothetical protein [Prauserella rugosa]KID28919.1 hypothetical protein HQ32_03609 [Prauserella sp. Am3]TWH22550.1 hypothetical protein JD82_04432 [Prauserella rugosa]
MSEDAGKAAGGSNFWDKFTFAIKGEKGTATESGWLTGAVSSVGESVNGRFELDPESAESIVKTAEWAVGRLRQQASLARELTSMEPPAKDPGSEGFNSVAVRMFELGADHVDGELKQHRDLADKLRKALDVYQQSDQQAGNDMKKAGGESSDGGYLG